MVYSDPSGRFPLIIAFAIGGALLQGAATGNWNLDNLAIGAFKGAALALAFSGVASLIGAAQGAVAGSTALTGTMGIGSVTGIGGAISGFAAPSAFAYAMSGFFAVPAAVGLFDPNASGDLKAFARGYLLAGSIANLGKAGFEQMYGAELKSGLNAVYSEYGEAAVMSEIGMSHAQVMSAASAFSSAAETYLLYGLTSAVPLAY